MPDQTIIRLANQEDVEALANLAGQLGYAVTVQQISHRLAILLARTEEHAVFVADRNGQVLGWVHAHTYRSLLDDPKMEIEGLIVDETARGQGIGEGLMQAAEARAKKMGCGSVYLHSKVIRAGAHEFYERIGYEMIKSHFEFRKKC
jgi:GNAT superfamily N-acetyltransferase